MADEKTYRVNEVFYSIQGEGVLAGTPMVFVRFSRCNMECRMEPGPRSPGGFDCDTEFESGRRVTLKELGRWAMEELDAAGAPRTRKGTRELPWMLLTGGEPGLQVDRVFCEHFRGAGWRLAVETNGSVLLPTAVVDDRGRPVDVEYLSVNRQELPGRGGLCGFLDLVFPFEHVTVSPKVAEHAIRQRWAHEVRYVRGAGQGLPETQVDALHRMLSPAFLGDQPDPRAVATCVDLVLRNPAWRLSVQHHKLIGAR